MALDAPNAECELQGVATAMRRRSAGARGLRRGTGCDRSMLSSSLGSADSELLTQSLLPPLLLFVQPALAPLLSSLLSPLHSNGQIHPQQAHEEAEKHQERKTHAQRTDPGTSGTQTQGRARLLRRSCACADRRLFLCALSAAAALSLARSVLHLSLRSASSSSVPRSCLS